MAKVKNSFKLGLELLFAILVCQLAGGLGSLFTMPSIPTWYKALHKPAFNPPNWIFGPVWTALFLMMGISLFLVWEKGLKNKKVRPALMIFALQLTLNVLWSGVFFGLHSPLLAFFVILLLWDAILQTALQFHELDKLAGWLLAPYLLWVTFATVLNLSIWLLNR